MSLFKNHNNISDTEKEVEEYLKKRKEEGAYNAVENMTSGIGSQNNSCCSPDAVGGGSYQQNSTNGGNNGYYQQNNADGGSNGYYQQDIANKHCPTYYQQNSVNESSNYYWQNAANQGDYQQDIANKHCPTYYHNDSDNNAYSRQENSRQQADYSANQPKATGIFKHKKIALMMLVCFIAVFVTAAVGVRFLSLGFFGLLFCLVGIYVIVDRKSVTNANSKKRSATPIPIPIGLIFTIIGAISFVSAVINVLHQFGI